MIVLACIYRDAENMCILENKLCDGCADAPYFLDLEDDEENHELADAGVEEIRQTFTNSAVAHKLDSRKKSIKYSCSECKGTFYMYDKYDFCPRCGKRIVGVEG